MHKLHNCIARACLLFFFSRNKGRFICYFNCNCTTQYCKYIVQSSKLLMCYNPKNSPPTPSTINKCQLLPIRAPFSLRLLQRLLLGNGGRLGRRVHRRSRSTALVIVLETVHASRARSRDLCFDVLESGAHLLLERLERLGVLHLADLRR